MMKCIRTETIQAYIDHELNSAEIASVEKHLQSCTKCREKLDSMQALSSRLRTMVELQKSTQKPIPQFNYAMANGHKRSINKHFYLWSAIAAMVVVSFFLFNPLSKEVTPIETTIFIEMETFTDANKPLEDQEMDLVFIEHTNNETTINKF
ncbi:zf-HC2 domain-containing protein [Puteibacter caeruleilacunae]|nr:zf-HC2 domain-containing protein [Puteibacter caeruleilacunae]